HEGIEQAVKVRHHRPLRGLRPTLVEQRRALLQTSEVSTCPRREWNLTHRTSGPRVLLVARRTRTGFHIGNEIRCVGGGSARKGRYGRPGAASYLLERKSESWRKTMPKFTENTLRSLENAPAILYK